MRVALLTTGRTEWFGLGEALSRLFPGHTFYPLPTAAEVASDPDGFPYRGFTSTTLGPQHELAPPESARELVARAAQEALGDRRKDPADLVIILDDLELPNAHQPGLALNVMRAAVRHHLEGLTDNGTQDRTREVLLRKVSFHLIAPMIEAWLFGDANAIQTAGLKDPGRIHFGAGVDPEAFITEDADYLGASERDCPELSRHSGKRYKKLRPKWLGSLRRELHPKGYLQWLCLDGADRCCTHYNESRGGAAALGAIDWEALLARPPEHFLFLRALIEDLAYGLDMAPVGVSHVGSASPLTSLTTAPQTRLLRNL